MPSFCAKNVFFFLNCFFTWGSAFLIEDRFYADGYEEDHSKNVPKIIQNWVSKRHRYQEVILFFSTLNLMLIFLSVFEAQLSPYDIVPMNSCKLGDLPVRLGAHYLYLHQGNCFHSIIFSDMRTLHNGGKTCFSQALLDFYHFFDVVFVLCFWEQQFFLS